LMEKKYQLFEEEENKNLSLLYFFSRLFFPSPKTS